MAIRTGIATVKIRIRARYTPRRRGGNEEEVVGEIEVGDNPRSMSNVVLIGRVFRGILVIGIIAMIETTI